MNNISKQIKQFSKNTINKIQSINGLWGLIDIRIINIVGFND